MCNTYSSIRNMSFLFCCQDCLGQPDCVCTEDPCINESGNIDLSICHETDANAVLHTCYNFFDIPTITCMAKCQCAAGYENDNDGKCTGR